MSSPDPSPEPGWLFAPDAKVDYFRVVRPLGRGGMAEVYLARDTKLGRKVALKVIRPEFVSTREAVERFLFEAKATARFNHPHLVTIYAVGEHEGVPYVALEYLEGQTLRQRVAEERLTVAETVRVALAIALALSEAHQRSISHCDLKPENVMLAKDGRLRVLDFGLARVLRPKPARSADSREIQTELPSLFSPQSKTGTDPAVQNQGIAGTPAYMAPEQWEEREGSPSAADIWALGVILYELLAGHRPYEEKDVFKLALRICGDEPVPRLSGPEEVPGELADLVHQCLAKSPGERPAAAEVAGRLQRLLVQDRPGLAAEESPFRSLLAFDEQHRQLFFGRESEIAAFVERLREEPLLPVLGPSGARPVGGAGCSHRRGPALLRKDGQHGQPVRFQPGDPGRR